MLRLATAISALIAAVWIAGYIAIVAPVILQWMPPGQQNANFIFWASAGWLFFALVAVCNISLVVHWFKNKRPVLMLLVAALVAGVCLFQALGYQATYAVLETSEQRSKQHENTLQYRKQDALFQVAHKNSERFIGILLALLCINIVVNLGANVCLLDNSKCSED